MSWIAVSDAQESQFCADGFDTQDSPPRLELVDGVLPQGSLMVEARLLADDGPQTVLAFERIHPRPYRFSLQALPGGGLVLVIADGGEVFHTALHHDSHDRTDTLRITYSWDLFQGRGRLAIERPEFDLMAMIDLETAPALYMEDIHAISTDPRRRQLGKDTLFFAVSDAVEAIGPMPSLTAGVPILCKDHYTLAGNLRRGDLVETLGNGLAPVLQVVKRKVPARGAFCPVRLRAPYFGLQRDIVVAPDQRLVVGGSQVEYTFGREAVLVPARHLVNGVSAISVTEAATVTYVQAILSRHEALVAAGCPLESLYVGRIRRKPAALSASLLAPFERSLLPEHARSAQMEVRPFEAITLMQSRAA